MKFLKRKEKGITLIALVVTIIVLLILAGVSIAMLTGNNGLLNQAIKAKEETEISSEKEGINLSVINYQFKNDDKYKLGTTLYDKNADNSTIWDVIVSNGITYGTNWNYIETGTNIEGYGNSKNNYLVNYKTGELIELKEDDYSRLTHGTNIGITDSLIFNLDPSIIDTTDIEDLKSGNYESLWQNTTLNGFNWTENSGLTSKEFNFDGIDDYITVKYDSEEQKEKLAKNGFTFEYYGTITKGNSYNENKEIINYPNYTGIFCYWNGNENNQARFRFGIVNHSLLWNAGFNKEISDFSNISDETYHNIIYPINYTQGNIIYFTVTLDTSNSYEKDGIEYYKQTLYINGEKFLEGGYNKKNWEYFINNDLKNLNHFCIGRSSLEEDGWWHYSKMNAYTLRLYNRALNGEEVKDNYQKSKDYHENLQ